ncbi:MAG: threonylcarbamoyl-AMP synthase [Rhodocyclaceae bacterium]|nr:threonylcarbamoyl-AMP synthase [Rhodocyclaceae bacterium]MBX3668186.1 threonylcarbamoyl-AMP synthase [Rhodocyclaceae bacterium]
MTDALIARAVQHLRAGELVAMPTETVYGLAADARNDDAVRKIFAAKGRPADHPLIVHLPHAGAMHEWARDVPEAALALAGKFWPGPLTLILPRARGVSDRVTGGQDSVGLRVPGHPLALALLSAFGSGLAAPSANRYGRISPTTAAHVQAEFDAGQIAMVLDGGPCSVGLESTILDLTRAEPAILRPGAIRADQIAEILGRAPGAPSAAAPRVPGALAAHYAPRTPLRLCEAEALGDELRAAHAAGSHCAVLLRSLSAQALAAPSHLRVMPAAADDYARELYAALREADAAGADLILLELPPRAAAWLAVLDRLQRAAHGSGSA